MIQTYRKGYRAERELLRFLSSRGYSVARQASSGGFHSPVDVIAMKLGKVLAFEIKAWATKPKLASRQLHAFKAWTDNAGAMGFLAWYNHNTWRFLPLHEAANNHYDDDKWIELDNFFRIFL